MGPKTREVISMIICLEALLKQDSEVHGLKNISRCRILIKTNHKEFLVWKIRYQI